MKSFLEHRHLNIGLEYHSTLNPLLWDEGDVLNAEVRQRLIDIAVQWKEFAKIPAEAIRDVVISGGNVNFNFTKDSDIDVHLMIDYDDMPSNDKAFTMEYFMGKKDLWAAKHPGLRVRGFPVELFAQDIGHTAPAGQGSYSIIKSKWIVKPGQIDPKYDDPQLERIIRLRSLEVKNAIQTGNLDRAKELKDKLSAKRSEALSGPNADEFGFHNKVFKSLRNRHVLDRLKRFINRKADSDLSL